MTTISFPKDFIWGTATSSYQVEGAIAVDDRQESVWDAFCRVPGAIANDDDGTVAVDHYHRLDEDVDLIAALGVSHYRFSIAWPRVMRSDGTVNPRGLDFYDRLVDRLLEVGVEPWVTLFHWDLPTSLPGGWLSRSTAQAMVDYALAAHERLADRVRIWTTLNEPWCSSLLSYAGGEHAPGHTDGGEGLLAAHHHLLAHGLTARALREVDPDATLGITLNIGEAIPDVVDDPADVDAARRVDATLNRLWLDPIFKGHYPADLIHDAGPLWPEHAIHDGDLDIISTPIDVVGINYYTTSVVRARRDGDGPVEPRVVRGRTLGAANPLAPEVVTVPRALPVTDMGWEIEADGLRRILTRVDRMWTGPAGVWLAVTENGAACRDDVVVDARVVDDDRISYVSRHLAAVHAAREDGVDVRGYFLWSLIDNFEWAAGYAKKFGIVSVDDRLDRHPKKSFEWYSEVCRSGEVAGN
ncbi:GH1 family beta-glucosidase [Acidipropionibacterium timonense]|uniref:GH1 family beta-glucosidase n=1 Tax=Acidipropionibacterium timonense TaxID=2161818 RepID=UPI0010312056|nr:GH1 family beta-glucosidase [Acidipropionibacterium timonense]